MLLDTSCYGIEDTVWTGRERLHAIPADSNENAQDQNAWGDFRRFRDETLAATWYGRAFIRCYYAVSPTLVRLFGGQRWFRAIWKPRLDGMVRRLNGQGVADTPYQDRPW